MTNFYLSRALRTVACILVFLGIGSNALAVGYSTQNGRIYDASGQEIQLRGINHFGFNATILQPMYLWEMGWKEQIAQIKSLGFNAVRLPYVPDTLYNTTPIDRLSYLNAARNPEFIGKTSLQALDLWMAEANRVGLYVLLDFHSVSMQRQYPTWFVSNPADFYLTYNRQAYTPANWRRDLEFVARRYASLPHFLGIDIYNEPNGSVRWSSGDPSMNDANYFWKNAAESAATAILSANPNLLIFVQGVSANYDGVERNGVPINWGENFQAQAYRPLNVPATKLVLSPHTYGPDVYVKATFLASTFPRNLAADWEALFGQFSATYAVVPGEWGGRYGNGTGGAQDTTWQNAFVDYLQSKGMRNSFYWCYTPNSGDTGGILDDSLRVREDKLVLLRRLWNAPTATPPPTTAPLSIASFAPVSGSIGTIVTVNGRGFTGATAAWVGGAHNASLRVISDTQMQVTVPAGATTGAIGIFNGSQSVFTAQGFALTASAPVAQPTIANFGPLSGGVGTVVTINGAGFSGLTHAWVGNAHNAGVRVVSNTQVQVTIPAGATSGAIGIFNSQSSAFTPVVFTVAASAPSLAQPSISNFSPAAGAVGSVVTLNGRGFTGMNQAWVGNARNVAVRIMSDTQIQVTIPAGATSGAIGLLNPSHAAFTATSFTVR